MSDRSLFSPNRALADMYTRTRQRELRIITRQVWPGAVQSDIQIYNEVNFSPSQLIGGPGYPDEDIVATLTVGPGRWVFFMQSTQRLESFDAMEIGSVFYIDGVEVARLVEELGTPGAGSWGPQEWEGLHRFVIDKTSTDDIVAEVFVFAGEEVAEDGDEEMIRASIIAYPG